MPRKEKVISEHRMDDATLIRKKCIKIIKNDDLLSNATGVKAVVEAGKLLARLQHLLQVDKQVLKDTIKKESPPKPKLKPEHQALLDKIRNG